MHSYEARGIRHSHRNTALQKSEEVALNVDVQRTPIIGRGGTTIFLLGRGGGAPTTIESLQGGSKAGNFCVVF